jgi:YesN/AraC family two-component response regulator
MEEGTGIDIAHFLKEHGRLEQVIFYSAYKNFEYACLGMEYGVKLYITKDMGFHEIIKVMKELHQEMDAELHSQPSMQKVAQNTEDRISVLESYIGKHYKTATLESSARVLHMNSAYLSSYIKKTTGKNFGTFLTETRMTKAAEFLTNSNHKVVEICSLVGYSDVRYFIKTFSKIYGVSPGRYRKKHNSMEVR